MLRLIPPHVRPTPSLWRQKPSPFEASVGGTEFFARLQTLAFAGVSGQVRDHGAPWIVAALNAVQEGEQQVAHAPDVVDLLQTLHWSELRAQDVLCVVQKLPQAQRAGLPQVLERVVRLEQSLERSGFCDEPTALSRCLKHLRSCRVLPPGLARFNQMVMDGVVDLAPLHWRILAQLARLGLGICVKFPTWCDVEYFGEGLSYIEDSIQRILLAQKADFNVLFDPYGGQEESPAGNTQEFCGTEKDSLDPTRGAQTQAQENAASRIRLLEHAARATPCPQPPTDVQLQLAAGPQQEAHEIARQIVLWQRHHGRPLRIAVAVPALDGGANALAATLTQYSLRVRLARGKSLAEVPCLRSLLHLLQSKTVEQEDPAKHGSEAKRGQENLAEKKQSNAIAEMLEAEFPPHDSLMGYVSRVAELLQELQLPCSESDDESVRALAFVEHAHGVLRRVSLQESHRQIPLSVFATWLYEQARAHQLSSPAAVDDAQVQIVPFAHLWGQEFDYVVLAGLVQGRCPRNKAINPLLTKQQRLLLRKLLGRDVFAPGPQAARMIEIDAFDRLYFAAGLLGGRMGVVLSTWARDDQGRNVSPSVLFHRIRIALGKSRAALQTQASQKPHPLSLLQSHVAAARHAARTEDTLHFTPSQRDRFALFRTMAKQRAAFAANGKTGSFAFAVGEEQFRAQFGQALGICAQTPLTPSTIEAFAQCRFRGFLQRLLKFNPPAPQPEPLPPKLAGQVAHEVLRRFYQEDFAKILPVQDNSKQVNARLQTLVHACVEPFLRQANPDEHPVWSAYILWLTGALNRLVVRQALHPPVQGATPKRMELAIGVKGSSLSAVPIQVGKRTVYLGGVIDRMDKGQGVCAVVDYKMGSQAGLSSQLTPSSLLRQHFQLPVYHRLLHHHGLIDNGHELLGYLLSIRDGTPSLMVGGKRHPHWRERITQDDREDSLANALERVLKPLWHGDVPADAGSGCQACSLRNVCRTAHT